jgi:hypothetical protein
MRRAAPCPGGWTPWFTEIVLLTRHLDHVTPSRTFHVERRIAEAIVSKTIIGRAAPLCPTGAMLVRPPG